MNNVIVYFVTENGFMNFDLVETCISMFKEKDLIVEDFGMGSSYNMPSYLLGELEENVDKAIVVSFDYNDERFVPVFLVDDNEINSLINALKEADEEDDSLEIIKKVHKYIRG